MTNTITNHHRAAWAKIALALFIKETCDGARAIRFCDGLTNRL
jgi:hypothetical protein